MPVQGRLGDTGKPPGEPPTQLTPSEAKAPRNDDAPAARPPVVADGEVQYEGTAPLETHAKGRLDRMLLILLTDSLYIELPWISSGHASLLNHNRLLK